MKLTTLLATLAIVAGIVGYIFPEKVLRTFRALRRLPRFIWRYWHWCLMAQRRMNRLTNHLAAVTSNRDYCYQCINEIAAAIGMNVENASPDAVLRNVIAGRRTLNECLEGRDRYKTALEETIKLTGESLEDEQRRNDIITTQFDNFRDMAHQARARDARLISEIGEAKNKALRERAEAIGDRDEARRQLAAALSSLAQYQAQCS